MFKSFFLIRILTQITFTSVDIFYVVDYTFIWIVSEQKILITSPAFCTKTFINKSFNMNMEAKIVILGIFSLVSDLFIYLIIVGSMKSLFLFILVIFQYY